MKLTQQDFELFKAECEKWIKRFGLLSWEVVYDFKKLKNARAGCYTHYGGRVATLVLNSEIDENIKIDKATRIKGSALHEVLELLLSPLDAMAKDRSWVEVDYEKETHIVIRTLEKVLTKAVDLR